MYNVKEFDLVKLPNSQVFLLIGHFKENNCILYNCIQDLRKCLNTLTLKIILDLEFHNYEYIMFHLLNSVFIFLICNKQYNWVIHNEWLGTLKNNIL